MEFKFQGYDNPVDIPITVGDVVYVIGANGSGKSSLAHKLFRDNLAIAKRICAHRQTWFQTNAANITAGDKKNTLASVTSQDTRPEARWIDAPGASRTGITIFDLLNAENTRARDIAAAVDINDMDKVMKLRAIDSPLTVLNELLKTANLPIEISISDDDLLYASKAGSALYSIAELSDGERNAILIIANVLTAAEGTIFIIDEPERHLHRSIISPLLLSLFNKRDDCAFVVSTHDVSLPIESPNASVLLVRSCTWNGQIADSWDADLLSPEETITDDVKLSILGSRRKILFIEGDTDSLDKHIYSILYPSVSIAPSGNCVNVERAVSGIRNSSTLHWVSAFGLIDRDDRTPDEIQELATEVFMLSNATQ